MANEKLIIAKPESLNKADLVDAYNKLAEAFQEDKLVEACRQMEKINAEQAETIAQLNDAIGESKKIMSSHEKEAENVQSQLTTKDKLIKQLEEDLATAQNIIDEQNASIEQMDEEKGTETGNFFTHEGKKIECRIPKFSVKGTDYTLADLKENKEIKIPGKGGQPEKVGLTDYLLDIESPILEIEE